MCGTATPGLPPLDPQTYSANLSCRYWLVLDWAVQTYVRGRTPFSAHPSGDYRPHKQNRGELEAWGQWSPGNALGKKHARYFPHRMYV